MKIYSTRWMVLLLILALCNACAAVQPAPAADPATSAEPAEPSTLIVSLMQEPATLDAHKAADLGAYAVLHQLGASLLKRQPDGSLVGYLAEKWEISDDGLTYTFHLRQGITFHNGDPLRAQDYVYTIERAKDPKTASPGAGSMFAPIQSAKAVDDLTLELTLAQPFFPLLTTLATMDGYLQPLDQKAIEAAGDQYGHNPVGVGPYKLVDWQTGDKIVLERNPDFAWAPVGVTLSTAPIERIEYRILPDPTVRVAALEAGEVQFSDLPFKDVERVRALGSYEVVEREASGASPLLVVSTSKAPFDNLSVRQAFTQAIDKSVMIQTAGQGNGVAQVGPLSPSVIGYWSGVEKIGYPYDVAAAEQHLTEAGYTKNSDGIYEKDGQPLKVTILTAQLFGYDVVAQVAADLFKKIGVQAEIEQLEPGVLIQRVFGRDYEMAVFGYGYAEADVLYLAYHSKGSLAIGSTSDAELDNILEKTRTTVDPQERQQWVDQAQQRIVEQAYSIPLYYSNMYYALDQRVQGASVDANGAIDLFAATMADKK